MPSYSKAYIVGDPIDSEFFGSDLSPRILILQHENDRIAMRAFYLDESVKPISNVKIVVPSSPDDPYMLLDAVIAFYPKFFNKCPSLGKVKRQLKNTAFLDLDQHMPQGWEELREEAMPYFKRLRINSAVFEENWRIDR